MKLHLRRSSEWFFGKHIFRNEDRSFRCGWFALGPVVLHINT